MITMYLILTFKTNFLKICINEKRIGLFSKKVYNFYHYLIRLIKQLHNQIVVRATIKIRTGEKGHFIERVSRPGTARCVHGTRG